MIEILIVDDHEVMGEGTRYVLADEKGFTVDFMKCSMQAAQQIKEKSYDIYILDLNMPKKNGLELTAEILKVHREAKVLIFTDHNLITHFNYLMDCGVSGFISKSVSKQQFIRTIQCAVDGEAVIPFELLSQLRRSEYEIMTDCGKKITLSPEEEEVLVRLSQAKSNKEIAEELHMGQRNVEHHLTRIYKKLDVKSRADAIVLARELDLIPVIVM